MKKKRFYLTALALLLCLASGALFAACGGGNKAPLLSVDADPLEVTATAAAQYTLPQATATSQNGGTATVEITGTDPDGAAVSIDGYTATIGKLGLYTFTYTAVEGELRSDPVVYKVTFTAPAKPVIYLAASGNETTVRQAKGIALPAASALSDSDDNVTVSVAGVDPDGDAVTITDGAFDAVVIGDYVFTYTATDSFGTAADPVTYTVHVTEYLLTMEVAQTEVSVEGAKNIALPAATVISSVDNTLQATVTVKSAPDGSDFAAGDEISGFVFTPDMAGQYVFTYKAVDSMEHSTDPVDVTVTVRYGTPAIDFTEAFPTTLVEGDEYTVPSFSAMGGSAVYDWLDYTTDDFDIAVEAFFTPLGEEGESAVSVTEPFTLTAGKLQIDYTATAKDNPEVTGTASKLIMISNPAFNDLRAGTSISEMRYRPGIYDRSYMAITTTAQWGGISVADEARTEFLSDTDGYMRWLVYNPNDTTLRMVFQHRGLQDGAERYGAVGTEYNSGSRSWEINLVFQVPARSYRELLVPRSYIGSNCNTIQLWTNNANERFDVLDFEILSAEDLETVAAYDFSSGLPVLTDGEGAPVADGSATIERVTYDGDDNALTITNTGAGDVYADLFGDGVDKSVVTDLFTAAGRGQTDMVLSFTVTNTGEAAAQYKVVVSNGKTFFEVEVVPEYDEYNEPTGGTTTATPTLEPGESRYIEIAASAMLGDYTGDFTAQLVLCGAGELTYSGFTLRKGSFDGYTPSGDMSPVLTVTKTGAWQDTVELTPGMTYTVPVEVSYRTFYDSDTLTATVTDPRGGKSTLQNGAFTPLYTGTYTITYTLTDSNGGKAEQSVSVEFTTDNPIVTVEGQVYSFETEYDKAYKLPEPIVLNGEGLPVTVTGTDPDGEPVAVSGYTFDAGKVDTYTFVYSVDAAGAIPATVTVQVSASEVELTFNSLEMPSAIPDHADYTVPDIESGDHVYFAYKDWGTDDFDITQSAFFTTDPEASSGTEVTPGVSDSYEKGYIKIRYEGTSKEMLNGAPVTFSYDYVVPVCTVFTTFSSAGSGLAGGSSSAAAVSPEGETSYVPVTPTHNGSSGIDINTAGSPDIEKFMASDDGYLVMWIYNEKDFTYKVFFGSYVKNATATKSGYINTGSRWEYQLAVQLPANGWRKLVIPRAVIDDKHTNFSMWAVETDGEGSKITDKPVTWRIYDFRYVDAAAAEATGITFDTLPEATAGSVETYENGFKLTGTDASVDLAAATALADFMTGTNDADEKAPVLSFSLTNTGSATVTVSLSSATSAVRYGNEEGLTGSIHLLPESVTLGAGETCVITITNEQLYNLVRRTIENARPTVTSFAIGFSGEGEVAVHGFTLTNVPVMEAVIG